MRRSFTRSPSLLLPAALLLLALPLASSALAQQTAPRVFVIFDTSGSMLWTPTGDVDCRGDGSPGHEHRGCAEGSKMFHAKAAVSQVLREVDGIEFALLRYGQLEPGDPGFNDSHVGARYRDDDGVEFNINYDGSTNGCGPADYLVEPGPMSRDDILSWMDGVEDYPGEKELRADGYTPLTDSVASAREVIVRAISQDPDGACRPYYVLVLTDGYQQCPDGSADDPAYRAIVRELLIDQAADLRELPVMGQRYDVRTFVVGFGAGTRFATELDDVARAGGTAVDAAGRIDLNNGTAYQADDPVALQAALASAVENARPRETCDGVDDDCDGTVDEGFARLGEECRVGRGACAAVGERVCSADGEGVECSARAGDPMPERCNGEDDDCDGQVDEGVLNRCGECGVVAMERCDERDNDCDGTVDEGVLNACGGCGPVPAELCDGVDQDCDGRVDEGAFNACGACGPLPADDCSCADEDCDNRIDEDGQNCPRCDCDPQPEACNGVDDDCDFSIDEGVLNACGACGDVPVEICNGLDDDCDGRIDEAFPEEGEACGTDAGGCSPGTYVCTRGELDCSGEVAPSTEVCDAADNDCDGTVDEGALNACGYCGATRLETCDNIDNDCDGRADEGEGLCNEGARCFNGECADPCEIGECFGGQVCLEGHCVTPCRNADCPAGQICDDGRCEDPCEGVECPEGSACSLGQCGEADCHTLGCPDGTVCRDGRCDPDPCAGAGCAENQGCFDGACFDDCREIACPEGTLCINGGCTDDPCARVTCPFPQTCVDGTCQADPCYEVDCPVGRTCRDGQCVGDLCIGVTCPAGATCTRGRCSGVTGGGVPPDEQQPTPGAPPPNPEPEGEPLPETEGCACDAAEGAPTGVAWFGLLVLIGLRRRRAR